MSLDELCLRADYVSLHIPAVAVHQQTCSTPNGSRNARKKGVRIINTARGELIDESALADAVEGGQVAGAGLDVFDPEPPKEWRLATLPQVVAIQRHRGIHQRSAGAGWHRNCRGVARFPQGRDHPHTRRTSLLFPRKPTSGCGLT